MKEKMRLLGGLFGVAALTVFLMSAQSGGASPPQSGQPKNSVKASAPQNEGEKKFQQNCSRCHNAPESLSSRITGTVVRHMRVRASLSQKDADAILRFLNP